MAKNEYRYLITEVDQGLPPEVEKFFVCLGFMYDSDATRAVTEHVNAMRPKGPPNSCLPENDFGRGMIR